MKSRAINKIGHTKIRADKVTAAAAAVAQIARECYSADNVIATSIKHYKH
jgi:hypothetical protein